MQRVERGIPELVEDPRPRPPEVDPAGVDVADDVDLGVAGPAAAVLVAPLDPQTPARDAPDRLVARLQVAVRVGHDEDPRLDGFDPAGAVRGLRAAAGQQGGGEEEGDERCAGHAATVWTTRRAHHGAVRGSDVGALGSTPGIRSTDYGSATELNWAGNYEYRAARLHRPSTLDQLRSIVAAAPRVRVLGSRHSFNDIADSAELVTLAGLPADVVVDRAACTVSCGGGMTYGELAVALEPERLALHNMASLPHISVAGAVATATHGSGDASGNLATAVAGLELVTSGGDVVTAARGDADFEGLVVGLGALGAVTRVTLDVEPAYEVRQRVFEGLAWEALYEHFDEISASGDSVSVFTRWRELVDQVWVKSRVTDEPERVRSDLFGASAATVDRHPILGLDAANCTPQLGRPGLWSDRLSHFRLGFTPSSGDELQSEYVVARRDAVPAIRALRGLGDRIRPVLQVCEIRTIAADRLWMSPQYGRDTIAFHFTWEPEPDAVTLVLADVEAALAEFAARPHWGKLFLVDAATLAGLYQRVPDFTRLCERLDPRGAFRNAWLEARVLGGLGG